MKAIVLAGGKGTRIQDPTCPMPKVLREANGKPLLGHVIDKLDGIDRGDITIVVGFMKDEVIKRFPGYTYAYQEQQLGTGHAVKCAIKPAGLDNYDGNVIILLGDAPLISRETLKKMREFHEKNGNTCTILTCETGEDDAYGRVIRENGKVVGIVEAKECTPEQRHVPEKNTGVMIFDCKTLCEMLGELKNDNSKGEYYLTDVPKMLIAHGKKVDAISTIGKNEICGVNTKEDLELVERILKEDAR